MESIIKPNFLKLVCSFFLVSNSSFGYSLDLLDNYKDYFTIVNNVKGVYLDYNKRTMTEDREYLVSKPDSYLHIGIENGGNYEIATGRIVSSKTTTALLNNDGHNGKIEAELKFTCSLNSYVNVDSLAECKRVWPGFWLWRGPYGKTSAEIDIAEFQVQLDGVLSHSNHIFTVPNEANGIQVQMLKIPYDYWPTTPHTVKYGLKWSCDNNYTFCKVTFLENGNEKKVKNLNSYSAEENKIINGFREGYQIVFTQHFNSRGEKSFAPGEKENLYEKFSGRYSEMIIKSLSISNDMN